MNVSVILDFEHFDAFLERRGVLQRRNHLIAKDLKLCSVINLPITEETNVEISDLNVWQLENMTKSDPISQDFDWKSRDGVFPEIEDIKICVKSNKRIFFIGASHMRYAWDYFIYLYISQNFLSFVDRKHAEMEVFFS
jgi:hypothetical protein